MLKQVGRQICSQAGSDSDRKLHKPADAGGEADRLANKEVADRWGKWFFFLFFVRLVFCWIAVELSMATRLWHAQKCWKSSECRRRAGSEWMLGFTPDREKQRVQIGAACTQAIYQYLSSIIAVIANGMIQRAAVCHWCLYSHWNTVHYYTV